MFFFFLGCPSCFASCLVLPCTFHWYTGTVYVLALSFMIVLCRSWQPMFPVPPPLPCAIFMFHCSHGFSCNLSSHVPSLCSFAHWFSYGVISYVPSISYCTLHIPIIYPSTILQIVNMAQMYTFTCAILAVNSYNWIYGVGESCGECLVMKHAVSFTILEYLRCSFGLRFVKKRTNLKWFHGDSWYYEDGSSTK